MRLAYTLIEEWLDLILIQTTQWEFLITHEARLDDAVIQTTLQERFIKLTKITKRKVINGQVNHGFITPHNLLKSKLFVKEYLQHDFTLECQYHVGIFHSYFIKILCNSLGSIHLFSFNVFKPSTVTLSLFYVNNSVNFIRKI